MRSLSKQQVHSFQETVWTYFAAHRRDMPWRDEPTPYHVLVSELMLQQTQVVRVLPKFQAFTARFPDIQTLAAAPLSEVLALWSGLGYNRRAKFLHAAAQKIGAEHRGIIPQVESELIALPGVGKNTAGAVLAYAFNKPVAFVETNIRTVFFHHFFVDEDNVDDKDILELVLQTLDREHPRGWYWALMDYGAHLKVTAGSKVSQSKHYVRQSTFEGSRRQLRGEVIRRLLAGDSLGDIADDRLVSVLDDLQKESFIEHIDGQLRLRGEADTAIIATDEKAVV